LATVSGSVGALPLRVLLFVRGRLDLGPQVVVGALDRGLDELAVERAVDDDRLALLELDQDAAARA
jgi:hypothetical protein